MLSKDKKLDSDGVSPHAVIINKVFEMHRKSHHYSIRKTKPELYERIFSETQMLNDILLKEALDIYENSLNKTDEKKPHPNYFLAICRRLKLKKGEIIKPRTIWGKAL